MAHIATISSKGQVVIPAELREELGLKPGVKVVFKRSGKGLHLEPRGLDAVLALCGKYSQYPLEADLLEERQKWDERLEAM